MEYCNSNQTIIREQYYLDLLYPEYNILPIASSSLGKLHTEETKIKISDSLKGKFLFPLAKHRFLFLPPPLACKACKARGGGPLTGGEKIGDRNKQNKK